MKICEIYDFSPIGGVVTLNSLFPARIITKMNLVLDILRDQNNILKLAERNLKYWSYPKFDFNERTNSNDDY